MISLNPSGARKPTDEVNSRHDSGMAAHRKELGGLFERKRTALEAINQFMTLPSNAILSSSTVSPRPYRAQWFWWICLQVNVLLQFCSGCEDDAKSTAHAGVPGAGGPAMGGQRQGQSKKNKEEVSKSGNLLEA